MRLAARSPLHCEPGSASSTGIVVRCEARHNKDGGDHRKAEVFKNVRQALHLCVGARVMLTQNSLWSVPIYCTFRLDERGPRRGRRHSCTLRQALRAQTDTSLLVPDFLFSVPGTFPRGIEQCPVPDIVVVHFPRYTGPACFANLPRTWVPIPCAEVRHMSIKSLARF